jgi:prepilin-type N-terminal cleavage/methylation domain-containing protein
MRKKAFTFTEFLLVISLLGIFAVIAVPRLNFALVSRQKVDYLARKIVTDLRRTRELAISNAANNSNGFALNMLGSAPYATYEIANLSDLAVVESHTIDSSLNCIGGAVFRFGPLGNLLTGSDTQLTVTAEGKSFTITIIPATGGVQCVEN